MLRRVAYGSSTYVRQYDMSSGIVCIALDNHVNTRTWLRVKLSRERMAASPEESTYTC